MNIYHTQDGSLSCIDPETGELYHNAAGAYTEAMVNYVSPLNMKLLLSNNSHISLIDACYGLGYNSWVFINEFLRHAKQEATLNIVAIERDPEIIRMTPHILNFGNFDTPKFEKQTLEHNTYYRTQQDPSIISILVAERPRIHLEIYLDDLRSFIPHYTGSADIIFHDPFSPHKIPELWTVDLFKQYHRILAHRRGALLTYSTAAAVSGALLEAGFSIYRTQGVGRKSGGTIAWATQEADLGKIPARKLTTEEMTYIESKAGLPYRDAGFMLEREAIITNRKQEQASSARLSGGLIRKSLPK